MSNIYVGFSVDFPEVRDPHITLAFIPDTEERYDSRGNPRNVEDSYGVLIHPMKILFDHVKSPFNVVSEGIRFYGIANDVRVLEVEMPSQIHELVTGFRQGMHVRGIKYSLAFPFRPHISIGDIPSDPGPGIEYPVTGLFIDNGEERRTLYLK